MSVPGMFHIHQYSPYAVDNATVKTTDPDGNVTEAPVTYILRRCTCGDVESEELDGTWSLQQVKGRTF